MFDENLSPSSNILMATLIVCGVFVLVLGIPSVFNPMVGVVLLYIIAAVLVLSCIAMIFSAITDIDVTVVLSNPIVYHRTIFKWFNTHDHYRLGWWKIHKVLHSGNDIDTIITLSQKE